MRKKLLGLTLIELLVATALMGIVFTSALGMVNHLSYAQNRVENAQRFYQESKFLMDRLSLMVRNYTIDYDRFWEERQKSLEAINAPDNCRAERLTYANFKDKKIEDIVYQDIFYEDTQDLEETSERKTLDTLRGGVDKYNQVKPCAQALESENSELFLISGDRTSRLTLTFDATAKTFSLKKELAADLNGDGNADLWGTSVVFEEGVCHIYYDDPLSPQIKDFIKVLGDKDPESCTAHEAVVLHPSSVEIEDLKFKISPDRDPWLNFEVKEARKHPFVEISLKTRLGDASSKGFTPETTPTLTLRTGVSSRVYGNLRLPHSIYRFCVKAGCAKPISENP